MTAQEQTFFTYLVAGLVARGMTEAKAKREARARINRGKKAKD